MSNEKSSGFSSQPENLVPGSMFGIFSTIALALLLANLKLMADCESAVIQADPFLRPKTPTTAPRAVPSPNASQASIQAAKSQGQLEKYQEQAMDYTEITIESPTVPGKIIYQGYSKNSVEPIHNHSEGQLEGKEFVITSAGVFNVEAERGEFARIKIPTGGSYKSDWNNNTMYDFVEAKNAQKKDTGDRIIITAQGTVTREHRVKL